MVFRDYTVSKEVRITGFDRQDFNALMQKVAIGMESFLTPCFPLGGHVAGDKFALYSICAKDVDNRI